MLTHPLLLVTGLSGAGKTQVMKGLEDYGFFCIDNLPPSLLPQLTSLHLPASERGQRLAVAIDARGQELFAQLEGALRELDEAGVGYQVLFLDCADDVLVRRYSESRRRHPMRVGHSLYEQIEAERRLLANLRARATYVLDTSTLNVHESKQWLGERLLGSATADAMLIDIVSFGFKHGVPLDADLVFDVRFLPNPHYQLELQPLTGLDEPVATFVMTHPEAQRLLAELVELLARWIPLYAGSGKPRLTVAIGCTGGQHRSVTLAERLRERLARDFARVSSLHRDLPKAPRAANPRGA